MRANSPPAVKVTCEFVTATSCPFAGVIVKHQTEKLVPGVVAYTNLPLGSTVTALGPLPFVAVNGEPSIGVSAPLLGLMLNPETLPVVDENGGGLLAAGFAT